MPPRGSQVPNMAPILGELAFFLGITQPRTVKTRPDGDLQLLVLSKDDSYSLFDSYPEQVLTRTTSLSVGFRLALRVLTIVQTELAGGDHMCKYPEQLWVGPGWLRNWTGL